MFHVKHSDWDAWNVSRETIERLEAFAAVLERWSSRINLISRNDMSLIWERHILDSLQLTAMMPPDLCRATDLGSGAGFPGLILAIASGIPFDLVDSDHRKAAFLREAARVTAATVTVHATRVETVQIAKAPLVTARALAPLPRLLPLAASVLAPEGMCLFLKGAQAQAELDEARQHWHMEVRTYPSRTSADATILEIRELRHV